MVLLLIEMAFLYLTKNSHRFEIVDSLGSLSAGLLSRLEFMVIPHILLPVYVYIYNNVCP